MAEEAQVTAAEPTENAENTAPDATLLNKEDEVVSKKPRQVEKATDPAPDDEWDGEDVQLDTKSTSKKDDPNLILGKFKTADDLAKAYQELEKKQSTKAANAPPEKYEIAKPMQEIGWMPLDADENAEVYQQFEKKLRDNNFTQKQTEFMFELGKDIIVEQISKMGPATDAKAEMASLKGEWGKDYDTKRNELSKWAMNNLNSDVLNKPLSYTKEGMKMLYDLMAKSKGSSPITDSARAPAFDKNQAQIEINDIMKQPEYWKSGAAGDALRQKVEGMYRKMR